VQPATPRGDERPHLTEQDRVPLVTYPVEHDDVPGHVLEERADGRDAHTAGDQQHAAVRAVRRGERAVRAFEEHLAADPELSQSGTGVTDGLGGEPQRMPAGRGRQ
jgi:hypothetical protein